MSSKEDGSVSESDNMCVVCFKNVEFYSIGICDHPVCSECSTRIRVLCGQTECPICRQDMPRVIFSDYVDSYRNLKTVRAPFVNEKDGIWFLTSEILYAYTELVDFGCTKCPEPEHFQSIFKLRDHLRKVHELHYCELCLENLRIFPWERKSYTRSELAQHRRKGDPDDKSHRGHPLCEFCDTRYMDSDDLFRHLRRDHLFCHFCDSDGLHQYYASYECLRQHFKSEHYLCVEGNCLNEKFTSVFRTDIDLKAHKASVHSKHLGKVATKQARTLELEFTLRPRNNNRHPHPELNDPNYVCPPFDAEAYLAAFDAGVVNPLLNLTPQNFPSLGGTTKSTSPTPRPLSGNNVTIRHVARGQKGLVRTNENFPALASDSNTVRLSVNSSSVGPQETLQTTTTTNAQNVSIHVNHRPIGPNTAHINSNTSNGVKIRPRADAFPALGDVTVSEPQWVKQGPPKEQKPKATKVAAAPVLPMRNSQTDFPQLNASKPEVKPKKTTSVSMPVTTSWTTEQSDQKETKNKGKKKKSKGSATNINSVNEQVNYDKTTSAYDTKLNSMKKEYQPQTYEKQPATKQNGVIKKRTELKIDSLHISESPRANGSHNDFPALGHNKMAPAVAMQAQAQSQPPPPGFASNDLTFTNSSGQSYSILPPTHFSSPPNFAQRNQKLIESFMGSASNDDIMEFKTLSNLFRSGVFPAEEYYRHCKEVMKGSFSKVFPELLVLLPDIDKQQDLYSIHCRETGSNRGLEVCATCTQVVTSGDLRSHLASHRMDNHFPALGAQELPSVWKKP